MTTREAKLARLSDYQVDIAHPYYLVYRPLNKALALASEYADSNLLDIGCGNKPYEAMFTDRVTSYMGCDIVQSSDNKADVVCEVIELPFASETFRTVLSTQVIEHVAETQRLIDEAYRVLAKGGHFILAGPMYWHLHEEPYDFFRFTKYGLRYILEKAGFEIVRILPNGGKWAVLGQVFVHTLEGSRLYRKPLIRWSNKLFAWLDAKKFNEISTLNYVVVAVKH